jgi:hypothetical protein
MEHGDRSAHYLLSLRFAAFCEAASYSRRARH